MKKKLKKAYQKFGNLGFYSYVYYVLKDKDMTTSLTNESTHNVEFNNLVSKLLDMASTGTIDNNDIDDLHMKLKSARKKMFTARITPADKAAAVSKGKLTKQWNKLTHEAVTQTLAALNMHQSSNIKDIADQFALGLGLHRDKLLQEKYNKTYSEIIANLASTAGLGMVPDNRKLPSSNY